MGLFDDLPPQQAKVEEQPEVKRARLEQPAGAPPSLPPPPSADDLADLAGDSDEEPGAAEAQQELQRMEQQQREREREGEQQQREREQREEGEDAPPPPPPPPPAGAPPGGDQVSAALRKIAGHIGHPKKFSKASALLRELLGQGAVKVQHGPLLFSALKAAMADPAQAAEPLLAREYSKLFTAASKAAEVFTVKERAQLDVYGTWAVLRNQLATTDDSFAFNKVVARLKEMAGELPEADEGDDEVLARLQAAAGAPDPVLAVYDQQQQGQQAGQATQQAAQQAQQEQPPEAPAPAQPEADAEADPFGLDALLQQQEAEAAAARAAAAAAQAAQRAQPRSVTWSSGEAVNQRRAALLDCVEAAKACYRNMWARTSVDLLVDHVHGLRGRFAPSQRPRLDALAAFVREQRRVRKIGPSAKEVNRDSTSFERARAEWGRAAVSHRGKVGAGGDHKTETWLG